MLPRVSEAAGSRRKELTSRADKGFLTLSMSPSNLDLVLLPQKGVGETFECDPDIEYLWMVLRSSEEGEDGSRSSRPEVPIFLLVRHEGLAQVVGCYCLRRALTDS